MEEWRSAPVFAMAANRGPLTERIVRVLGLKTLGAGVRASDSPAALLCLTAALVAGNALLGMAHPRSGARGHASGRVSLKPLPTAAAIERRQHSSGEAFRGSSAKHRAAGGHVHQLPPISTA